MIQYYALMMRSPKYRDPVTCNQSRLHKSRSRSARLWGLGFRSFVNIWGAYDKLV